MYVTVFVSRRAFKHALLNSRGLSVLVLGYSFLRRLTRGGNQFLVEFLKQQDPLKEGGPIINFDGQETERR